MRKFVLFFFAAFFLILHNARAQEGSVLWFKPNIGTNLEAIPAVDAFGNVYILAGDHLYSYTSSGEQRWNKSSRAAKGGDANSVSVSMDNNVVYVPGIDGIRAFRAEDGTLIWESNLFFTEKFGSVVCESKDGTTLYIGSGGDYIGSETEYIYAINSSTGEYFWRWPVDFSEWPECCRGFMAGSSIDVLGNVYLTGQNGILYSFKDNRTAYTENWTFNLGAESRMPVAIDNVNGFIYACSNNSVVYKLDTSGNVLISKDIEAGEVFAALVLSPDGKTIYINAEDAKLHALSTLSFAEKWSYEFESWGSDPLVRDDGVVIVMGQIDGAARVCAIRDDNTSATLLWSSNKIISSLVLNEINVNIGPEGNIYVHTGEVSQKALYAIQGNGKGLSTLSPWPKIMGSIQNNGIKNIVGQKLIRGLLVNTIGNGSISLNPSGGLYNVGSEITATAMPALGYKFDNWVGDLTGHLNPSNITMSRSKTITAYFSPVDSIWNKIDDVNERVSYTGTWGDINDNALYYLNTAKFKDGVGGTVRCNFTGSRVKIVVLRASDLIITIDVSLDGVFQGEYSLEAGKEEISDIYISEEIPEGLHTISFTNTSSELSFDYFGYTSTNTLGVFGNNVNDVKPYTLNIYPNPVKGNTLHMKVNELQGDVKVFIIDMNGRFLISQSLHIEGSKIEMELTDLKRGLYFVKMVSEKHGSLVKRIILK